MSLMIFAGHRLLRFQDSPHTLQWHLRADPQIRNTALVATSVEKARITEAALQHPRGVLEFDEICNYMYLCCVDSDFILFETTYEFLDDTSQIHNLVTYWYIYPF